MPEPISFVLDTNVVIDWLVFDHPYLEPFRELVSAGQVRVLRHPMVAAEFARVLAYPALKLGVERRTNLLERYRDQTFEVKILEPFALDDWKLPAGFPSCRDRDDDLFLAFAYHARAAALVTRDKVLLKMRKKVRKFGVVILDVPQLMTLLTKTPAAAIST
jgi:putative PIN family toxin of toxin-antitoxin system